MPQEREPENGPPAAAQQQSSIGRTRRYRLLLNGALFAWPGAPTKQEFQMWLAQQLRDPYSPFQRARITLKFKRERPLRPTKLALACSASVGGALGVALLAYTYRNVLCDYIYDTAVAASGAVFGALLLSSLDRRQWTPVIKTLFLCAAILLLSYVLPGATQLPASSSPSLGQNAPSRRIA